MIDIQRVDFHDAPWDEIDRLPDRLVYQTREWVSFVARTQGAEPLVVALTENGRPVGYFTGLLIRRYGIRILGSPLPGWTTSFMGFNFNGTVSASDAVEAILSFAFGPLRCMHVELRDRGLVPSDVAGLRLSYDPKTFLEVDLTPPESEIWARMKGSCRTSIRKAEKVGVVIEEATDERFVDDYYAQLTDVFAKQALVPTYSRERVTELIRTMHPTGRLLLLRAQSREGNCVATGIFPAMNKTMHFWGGASWRRYQILQPNEALMWYAMRYWKERGIERCDLGGAQYNRKYGPTEVMVPWFRKSRFRALSHARDFAQRGMRLRQRGLGHLRVGERRRHGTA
jgi:CelD/BcsL family acetyltransferase involved in cellulose biosynthesis